MSSVVAAARSVSASKAGREHAVAVDTVCPLYCYHSLLILSLLFSSLFPALAYPGDGTAEQTSANCTGTKNENFQYLSSIEPELCADSA